MRFEDRDTHLYEDDHDHTGDLEKRGGRRLLVFSGIGAAVAVVAVVGIVALQQDDSPAAPAAAQAVAISPDGLSPQVSAQQIDAGTPVAEQALAGKLGLPSGVAATDVPAVPAPVMLAYRRAESTLAAGDGACHLPWWVLAGIGKTETDHANGGRVDASGVATPLIRGPRLDGTVVNTEMVLDTDQGTLDGDTMYDRGMGLMQLMPGTWKLNARDGDGDGTANPDDIYDAALTAGTYLCTEKSDLSTAKGLAAAVLRYNNRPEYLRSVLQWGTYYRSQISPPAATPAPVVPGPVKTAISSPTGAPTATPAPDRTLATKQPAPSATAPAPATTAPKPAPTTAAPKPTTKAPTKAPTTPAPTRTVTPTTPTTPAPRPTTPSPTRTVAPPTSAPAPEPTRTVAPPTSAPSSTPAPSRTTVAPAPAPSSPSVTNLPALPEDPSPTR